MVWRLIREDGAGAAAGLAGDEVLACRAGLGLSLPTLRLYTYRAHAALVGRFQNVGNEIHLPYCEARGIDVNRRPTGGGAIIMGPDQLGVALALRGRGQPVRARELMARFSSGLVGALQDLGIRAAFRGKNDLEAGGRKIAGLGICRAASGGLLFHASLLVDLDVPLMVRVLRLPVSITEVETLADRTATVRGLLGEHVAMEDVRACVAQGFASGFAVDLEEGELNAEERDAIETIQREKYRTDAWLFQRTLVPDTTGSATVRTPGGALEVHVASAGSVIKSVHLRGDFFDNEAAVADLEARLRWHSSEPAAVVATVRIWRAERPEGTVDAVAMADAIVAAVHGSTPYGCFVSPGGGTARG